MSAIHPTFHTTPNGSRRPLAGRRGFSLVELMVVVSIIAVLVGLLLVALSRVRGTANVSQTRNVMREFSAACDQFQQEYGRYPGAVPETVLAGFGSGPPPISTTENAILDLMGGHRVLRPGDQGTSLEQEFNDYVNAGATNISMGSSGWAVAVNVGRIGEGPVIDGKATGPFMTPDERSFATAQGQAAGAGFNLGSRPALPDMIDAWGQPMIYLRRQRSRGPLVSDDPSVRPQFLIAGLSPYLESTGLGEIGASQIYGGGNPAGSILTDSLSNYLLNWAYLLRNPGLGSFDDSEVMNTATARGAYAIISAGPDGVFFSASDGPGAPGDPVTDLANAAGTADPSRLADEYDDLRTFGGG